MTKIKNGKPFITIFITLVILAGLSFVPWGKLTGRFLKDFNLIGDLCPSLAEYLSNEVVDPELLAAMKNGDGKTAVDTAALRNDSILAAAKLNGEVIDLPVKEAMQPRVNGKVIIEDYTRDGSGLAHFKDAVAKRNKRTVRVAMIGDSYIEGDVLSQDIRQLLQDLYGGHGVGYMCMQSELTGFRQSVRQTCSGWSDHDVRKNAKDTIKTIAGEYYTITGNASTVYKGTSRLRHADKWNDAKFLFISPNGGTVSVNKNGEWANHQVAASNAVQCISVGGSMSEFGVKTTAPGLKALGVWMNDSIGITLDCMSLRGNSGMSHRNLNPVLSKEMAKYIDYDLIIVEYGINALTSQQSDYSQYGKLMLEVIARVRQCYPNADILLMGIGDRGQKQGSVVHSIATAQNMVDMQRDIARRAQVVFWDTREAMGGEDAIVKWREAKHVNADYIHLNHEGGSVLAQEFINSLKQYMTSK